MAQIRKKTQRPASHILRDIQTIEKDKGKSVPYRPLSYTALLKRQKVEPGGELEEDPIVVASVQPFELDYEAAKQLRENLVESEPRRQPILDALNDICANDKLDIYFVDEGLDLEYCVHNAGDRKAAKLYLKHWNDYIEWPSGQQAYDYGRSARKKSGDFDLRLRQAALPLIKRGVTCWRGGHSLDNLKIGMHKCFGKISEEVMELCLKGHR